MSVESLPCTLLILLAQFTAGVASLVLFVQVRRSLEPGFVRLCPWLTTRRARPTTIPALIIDPQPDLAGYRIDVGLLDAVRATSMAMLLFSFVHAYFLR